MVRRYIGLREAGEEDARQDAEKQNGKQKGKQKEKREEREEKHGADEKENEKEKLEKECANYKYNIMLFYNELQGREEIIRSKFHSTTTHTLSSNQ